MQRKSKIALIFVLGFMAVATVATPFVLKAMVADKLEQMRMELAETMEVNGASVGPSAIINSFPRLKDVGEAYEVTMAIPDAQEIEVSTQFVDQKLILSGKMSNKIERNSENFASAATSTGNFSFTLRLAAPIDEAAVVTKRETGSVVVILPKAE